jgi:hypothetical protein
LAVFQQGEAEGRMGARTAKRRTLRALFSFSR